MIGAALARELTLNGVRVLALTHEDRAGFTHPLLRRVPCTLEQLADFTPPEDFLSCDVFYHFAWAGTYGPTRDDAPLQLLNIRYALDAVALAKRLGCRRVVGAGSQAEYGRFPPGEPLRPDTPARPFTGYGIAKLAAGQLGGLYAKNLGLCFTWVRILSVYGPMEKPHSLITSTILKLLKGEQTHFTKGEQLWDFLYCDDAARAFRLIGEKGVDGRTYVLGSGRTIALKDALTTLCGLADPAARAGLGDLPYPENQVMYLCADISQLTLDTGFKPQMDYRDGIQKTIEWVREQL